MRRAKGEEGRGDGVKKWEWRTERKGKEEDERKLHRKKGADKEAGEESERLVGMGWVPESCSGVGGCDTGESRCTPHCSGE